MKDKKVFAIASLVLALIPIVALLFDFGSLDTTIVFIVIGFVMEIAAVVLGFIGISSSKGLSIAGIVLGIIIALFLGFSLIGVYGMKNAKDCVEKENGISVCNLFGEEIEVPTEFLTEEQMKKGE